VGSRTVRGYGSTAARDWYAELPEAVRDLVDLAGFGSFCVGLLRCPARRTLMAALTTGWRLLPFYLLHERTSRKWRLTWRLLESPEVLSSSDLHFAPHYLYIAHTTTLHSDFASKTLYLHSALLSSVMGLRIFPNVSPRVGGGRAPHDPFGSFCSFCRFSEIAGNFPHGGGPPGAGDDFDVMTLPPRVRPFIPERYAPPAHVLPRAIFRHFTDFSDRAPRDLLLREPEHHLSYEAREVGSRTVRGYGSTTAREWYAELPEAVRDLVDLAGFEAFCVGLSHCPAKRTLLAALVERWWDTTNSFHFSATEDLTMTPLDFAVLTGVDIGGWPIPYDEDIGEWEAAWIHLLGARPPVDRASGRVRYIWFSFHFRREGIEPGTPEEAEQYARGFLMFLFGTTLFADRGNMITWQPWAVLGDGLRHQYPGGSGNSQYRFLLEGPVGRAWFLGERFLRQVWGYDSQDPPAVPPATMRTADRLSAQEVISDMQGTDALLHLMEGDYATYRRIYLMPPLTGVRAPPRRPTDVPSSSRARATDIPSSSRTGASRGRGGSIPPISPSLHHPGWPDMPTELTSWWFGTPYQVSLEPPLPDHRYVRDPDSPPPPVEYTDELLGMLATFEGMILRREAQLAIMGVQ
ncbi:Protein MAIN-LIKE 2, partial [Camellia lanceoleosa]